MHRENEKSKGHKLLTAVIILLILIIITTLVGSFFFTQKNTAPSVFGYNVFVMNGKGMEPSLKDKSAIITKVGIMPEKGDVALCKLKLSGNDNIVSVLRVVVVQEANDSTQYYLKSDKGSDSDIIIAQKNEIIGKADIEIPWLGKLISFATSRSGIIAFIIIPAALILISLLVSILKHTDDSYDEEADDSNNFLDLDEGVKLGVINEVEPVEPGKPIEPIKPVEEKTSKSIKKSSYDDAVFLPKRPEFIKQAIPAYDYEELAKVKPFKMNEEEKPAEPKKILKEEKPVQVKTKKEHLLDENLAQPTLKAIDEEPEAYFEKMIAAPLADPIIEEKNKHISEPSINKPSIAVAEYVIEKEPVMASAQHISLDKDGKAEYNKVIPTADIQDLEKVLPSSPKNNSDRAAQSIDNLLKSVQSSGTRKSDDTDNLITPNSQKTSTNKTLEEMMKMLDQHSKNN